MELRSVAIALAALLAGGCAAGTASPDAPRPQVSTVRAAEAASPPQVSVRAPAESGVSAVIGQRAESLLARFGEARIDLTEGTARKLQFAGESCVLDIFLYPVAADTGRVATHVDARRRADGAEMDRSGCIGELERR